MSVQNKYFTTKYKIVFYDCMENLKFKGQIIFALYKLMCVFRNGITHGGIISFGKTHIFRRGLRWRISNR